MTTVLEPLIDLHDVDLPEASQLWRPQAPQRRIRDRLVNASRPTPTKAVTVAAFALYVVMGFYLHYHLHFWINDELNRTTDAVYVAISRDPHLGAIGFYWPPLAQLIQIPFVIVLNPIGQTIMAGPVSSAACIALTIPVLLRIGRTVGLGRWTTGLMVATFAVNPVVIYYAANGMSEACFFLGGAVMLWGFLAYIQERSVQNIVIFTLGMSAVAMTRLEGPAVCAAMTVVATFNLRNLKRTLWDIFVLGLPPLAFFLFWIAVQWILLKDALFFLHQSGGGAPPTPGHAVWLPNTAAHPLLAVPWALHWVWVLGPALIAVLISIAVTPLSRRTRGSIGMVAGISVFLTIQIDQIIKGTGYGDPRYFVTAILFATVGSIWVAARRRHWWTPVWNGGLIAVLLVSGATGSWELTSPRLTHVEHECVFFEDLVARYLPPLGRDPVSKATCPVPRDGLAPWAAATHWLDARLAPSDRVLTDNSEIPQPDLLTHHSDQYIVQNDDDWHKTVSNPYFVTYIITESNSKSGPPDTSTGDAGATLIAQNPSDWRLVGAWTGAYSINHGDADVQIYHYVGPKRSVVPAFGSF